MVHIFRLALFGKGWLAVTGETWVESLEVSKVTQGELSDKKGAVQQVVSDLFASRTL